VATTAANVQVGVTGHVYTAPLATALPVTPTATLNAAFNEVGYINEDGLVTATSTDQNDIKAWQNGDIVRKVQDEHDVTYALSLLETNDQTLEVYYGNYTNGTVEVRADNETRGEWVFHVVDGGDLIRIVLPDGQVTDRGDIQYVNGNAVMYPIVVTAYPDASGVKAYLYVLGAGS
jgi:hypothetical protein